MAALPWLALVMAAAGAAPAGAPPVRLAPVTCPGFPDADVRAALRVEIRDRLVPDTAPAPPDFALVSVACAGDDVDLMIVGRAWDSRVDASPPAANFYGPFGALAVDAQVRDRGFSRMAVEAGADTGPLGGRWLRFVISGGLRF